jgi:hypothetical protein
MVSNNIIFSFRWPENTHENNDFSTTEGYDFFVSMTSILLNPGLAIYYGKRNFQLSVNPLL